MKLVIAEKPSVAKAIAPVIGADIKKNGYTEGNDYIVSWCFGHLVGLYYPNDYCDKWAEKPWNFGMLPMIPEQWKFKVSKDCKEQFNILKALLNDSKIEEVICATDADREGECIFRYVYLLSGSKKPVKRLWVSSLEESAIKEGFANLKSDREYDNLYSAGFCRNKADWLVGMNGSRLFSIKYGKSLNLGRVQTPTLAMIVKRDYDVKNFVRKKYFTVELDCGFKASSERTEDEAYAERIVSSCNGKSAVVTEVKKEIKTENPPKLFDLTTMQREANKYFGYTAQQTLDYQQSLYEAKLSSYPRTDCQYITEDMEESTKELIPKLLNILPWDFALETYDVSRCVNNKKVTGHPAILPTANVTAEKLNSLPEGQKNILLLQIARLFCAASLPHKYEAVKVTVSCENHIFTANGKTVIENGWKTSEEKSQRMLKNKKFEDDNKSEPEQKLPEIKQGQIFESVCAEKAEHFTTPPKPFTENTLLSAMEHAGQENYDDDTEKKGLGTPATRAGTIEGLVKHGYIERVGKKIIATEKGINLIKAVPEKVKSPELTAEWEMQLQQIERGEFSPEKFMQDITAFVDNLCTEYRSVEVDKSISFENKSIGKCPKCGKEVKKGKFGFYCTGKCGMNISKVYGKELTETQLTKLLSGKEISFTSAGKKTIVLPEYTEKEFKGKTYFQWKTKNG